MSHSLGVIASQFFATQPPVLFLSLGPFQQIAPGNLSLLGPLFEEFLLHEPLDVERVAAQFHCRQYCDTQ